MFVAGSGAGGVDTGGGVGEGALARETIAVAILSLRARLGGMGAASW